MFTRVLRLLIPALCTLTVLHYWWSLGSLSCCGYWSYWDVWWGTCSKCLSCSQFLGVFTEEELAKCTCTLYQEHHGKTPASLLGTWAVHVLSVVLWTVNKNALICEPLSFVLMKSRIETAVGNADESAFQKHVLNFFFCFALCSLLETTHMQTFLAIRLKLFVSYIDCYSTSNLVEVI